MVDSFVRGHWTSVSGVTGQTWTPYWSHLRIKALLARKPSLQCSMVDIRVRGLGLVAGAEWA